MIKPQKLKKGDTVATISLSGGMAGDDLFKHRYELGKKRLEEQFGLNIISMPNSLMGSDYLKQHPEARAKDFMDALEDKNIRGIICNIGGNDTIRLLPYINFDVIKNNPKVFMGYSDSTINHFMMYKAGITSYYGPCVMCEFAENNEMHEYTKKYFQEVIFENKADITITSSPKWTSEFLDWRNPQFDFQSRVMNDEMHGYEVLQGSGIIEGELLGGCIDVFPMLIGTKIWPSSDEWKNKILFLETSEDEMPPNYLEYYLRNLIVQGIIDSINGIIVGKPKNEKYYTEYKDVYKRLICDEAGKPNLPILYNVNIGHASPICIFPFGQKIKIDLNEKTITFLDKPMQD